jgi:hypothetical protein
LPGGVFDFDYLRRGPHSISDKGRVAPITDLQVAGHAAALAALAAVVISGLGATGLVVVVIAIAVAIAVVVRLDRRLRAPQRCHQSVWDVCDAP